MSESDSLDASDRILRRRLNILQLLTEKPLWKKRVAEKLGETPQSIGRDIDKLHQDDLLSYTLTGAEHDRRNYLIAYETTHTGEQALGDYQICTGCGEIIEPAEDCLHDYIPVAEAMEDEEGDS